MLGQEAQWHAYIVRDSRTAGGAVAAPRLLRIPWHPAQSGPAEVLNALRFMRLRGIAGAVHSHDVDRSAASVRPPGAESILCLRATVCCVDLCAIRARCHRTGIAAARNEAVQFAAQGP